MTQHPEPQRWRRCTTSSSRRGPRSRTSPEQPAQYWKSDRGNDQCGPFWIIFRIHMRFYYKPNPNLARASPTGSTVSGRWYSPDPSYSSDASSATAQSTWLAHASNRSCPPTLTASRAHVGYASTGRPSACARRRRQAPSPLRVRSHRACPRQVSQPQGWRTRTTTQRPARAYSTRYAINSSSARRRCWSRR